MLSSKEVLSPYSGCVVVLKERRSHCLLAEEERRCQMWGCKTPILEVQWLLQRTGDVGKEAAAT